MHVKIRPGARVSPKYAPLIGATVSSVWKRKATCTPRDFVEASRPKDSPSHCLFNWNLREAAEAHWIEQAKYYLRAIVIVTDDGKPATIRATVSIVDDKGKHGYVAVTQAARTPSYREQMLAQAYMDLVAFQRKYASLQEYCKAVDALIKRVKKDMQRERKKGAAKRKGAR